MNENNEKQHNENSFDKSENEPSLIASIAHRMGNGEGKGTDKKQAQAMASYNNLMTFYIDNL